MWAAIGTILGTATLLVAQDWRDGKHLFKRNGSAESLKTLRAILESQTQLKAHFNDDTTRLLEDHRELLRDIRDGQFEHNDLDKAVLAKLDEFDKYGIKPRTP